MTDGAMADSTHLTQFQLMAQYNTWVNDRLYALVATLPEADRQRSLGAFFHSIHGTLNHVLLGDRIWLGRFASATDYSSQALQSAQLIHEVDSLAQILYADFAELRQARAETDAAIEQWMQELQPDMLSARVQYHNTSRTVDRNHSLWFGLAHFFNHQTHHRSQVTTLLHQLGYDYGVTDFLAMYDRARNDV